jgi:hypothetical protein
MMPDKYSYKASKKKKAVRRPIIAEQVPTEAETEAALTPDTEIQPIVAMKPATTARASVAAKPIVSSGESRVISRVTNLGAELRRLVVISSLILIALVVASLTLK